MLEGVLSSPPRCRLVATGNAIGKLLSSLLTPCATRHGVAIGRDGQNRALAIGHGCSDQGACMLRGNVDVAINVGYDVPVTDIARGV